MDDWVVLSPSQWKLHKAIKKANQVLDHLKVVKHPDKTFIGKIVRGFDFLGYAFSPTSHQGLDVAKKTIKNHVVNIARLYEQDADDERIGTYIRYWLRWLNAGVKINHNFHKLYIYLIPTCFQSGHLSRFRFLNKSDMLCSTVWLSPSTIL